MKNYRRAFGIAVAINFVLLAVAGYFWWRWKSGAEMQLRQPHLEESKPAPQTGGRGQPATGAPPETPLAPVQLSPQRLQSIGVTTGVVELKNVSDEIRTVATISIDETRLSYVQLRFSGWLRKVFADAAYQYVHKGQPLFTIYSPDVVATEREYLLAKQNRDKLAHSSVPGVAAGADSLFSATAGRLSQWDVPGREISRLKSTGSVRQELEIDSPVSGYITERNALPNMYVQPETRLYTVADLSVVWVYAELYQADIGRIKPGDPVRVTTDAHPGQTFTGRVDFIYPQVDMNTRTQKVRLVFANPRLALTPGMFVNAVIQIPMGRRLVIPASGVLQAGVRQVAFVDHGGGYLEPRTIQLGARAGDDFIVESGLKQGERIVTSANFLIDSESQLQAAMGSFAPPPPGAGAASAMNRPAAQANLVFSTVPSPPHKGANTVRVKLTDDKGVPISGAEVAVTFFMPAMPAMGMAAMRTVAKLSDKGAGQYEGAGNLESGGTWQVTIVARKSGAVVASKQMTVSATGGM